MAMSVSIIDAIHGQVASGLAVRMERQESDGWSECVSGRVDTDGVVDDLRFAQFTPGYYRLVVDLGLYYATLGVQPLMYEVSAVFTLSHGDEESRHISIVVAPHACTISGHRPWN
jgi:5-hydroxyisourate hydrolase-like protein (transthyretin family)